MGRILSGSGNSVTTTYKMDRKQFKGISRWTFECSVEILEVHGYPPYDGSRWPRRKWNRSIVRRVVIEKKDPKHLERNKQKALGEEKLRKKEELRKKKKEKKKRQNEMEYEKRDLKHKDKRIKRKMRKYKSKELKRAMF